MCTLKNHLLISIFILSVSARAQQSSNGTFPTLLRIADKATNSSARIADVLENSRSYLPDIMEEVIKLRKQAERSADLAEKISSHGYIALGTFIIVSIGVSIGGVFVGARYFINERFLKTAPTEPTKQDV